MVHRSPYPDVHVPDVSLTEYVLGGAAARAGKPALAEGIEPGDAVEVVEEIPKSASGKIMRRLLRDR